MPDLNSVFLKACRKGDTAAVEKLIKQGLLLSDIRLNNNEALRLVSKGGYLSILKLFVEQGLTLDDIRSQNNLVLRNSCKYGDLNMVKYMVEQGLTLSDFHMKEEEGLNAVELAYEHGQSRVLDYIESLI